MRSRRGVAHAGKRRVASILARMRTRRARAGEGFAGLRALAAGFADSLRGACGC
jgi:hypothetical protein